MSESPVISSTIVPDVRRAALTPAQVNREFQGFVAAGAKINVAGLAKSDPSQLFSQGLKPKHRIDLFDTRFYLTNVRQIPELRFMVAYVVQPKYRLLDVADVFDRVQISARIIYKDLSLAWRVASHFTFVNEELWIGKGTVREMVDNGEEIVASDESTTDMPIEMQGALESLIKGVRPTAGGRKALDLVLRKAKGDRMDPYPDFDAPRDFAQSNPRNLINRNRPVARFTRQNDPTSLTFTRGFEPDLKNGVLHHEQTGSRLYGGTLDRYRVLSTNRKIQYYFYAGAKHVWLMPPQATTIQLSSYGVRTVDVMAADDLSIPGYEYHHFEETPQGPELYSQIPNGFAGDVCPFDEDKADASPWLDKIPVIKDFRRVVLGRKS